MAIFRGSRFEGVPFSAIRTADGVVKRFLHLRDHISIDEIGNDFKVRNMDGKTQLDDVAFEESRKERLFWVLADVNEILFPLDIEAGSSLVIPAKRILDEL